MRPAALCCALVTALVVLGGCGIPTGGAPDTIPRSEVPYGLAAAPSSTPPATSGPARQDRPRIYLENRANILVPSGRDADGQTARERLTNLLAQLTTGPTTAERQSGLTTALPPSLSLAVTRLDGGTATVDLTGTERTPSGLQSRLAVAQIVLTATSLPEIAAVLLSRDGKPVEAPLPSGELTSVPLRAADYSAWLAAPPS